MTALAAWVVEWIGNAVVALVATVAVSELLRFVVRWITDPRPDVPGEPPRWFEEFTDTVPLPGGGQ